MRFGRMFERRGGARPAMEDKQEAARREVERDAEQGIHAPMLPNDVGDLDKQNRYRRDRGLPELGEAKDDTQATKRGSETFDPNEDASDQFKI